MNELALRHHFPIISLLEIFQTLKAANSVVSGQSGRNSNSSEMLCMSSLPASIKKDRIKNNREKVETSFAPLEVNWGFLLPWKQEFWSNLPQNLMQPFSHPSDATHKIWSRLANWLQRYSSLKCGRRRTTMDDDGRTTDHWCTISSPCEPLAQVS